MSRLLPSQVVGLACAHSRLQASRPAATFKGASPCEASVPQTACAGCSPLALLLVFVSVDVRVGNLGHGSVGRVKAVSL